MYLGHAIIYQMVVYSSEFLDNWILAKLFKLVRHKISALITQKDLRYILFTYQLFFHQLINYLTCEYFCFLCDEVLEKLSIAYICICFQISTPLTVQLRQYLRVSKLLLLLLILMVRDKLSCLSFDICHTTRSSRKFRFSSSASRNDCLLRQRLTESNPRCPAVSEPWYNGMTFFLRLFGIVKNQKFLLKRNSELLPLSYKVAYGIITRS